MSFATEIYSTMSWKVLVENESIRVLHFGPLVCMHPKLASDLSSIDAAFAAQQRIAENWGQVSRIVILESARVQKIPSATMRRINAHLEAVEDLLVCSAVAVLGETVGTRLLRTMMQTGTALFGTGKQKVFGSVGDAVKWVRTAPDQQGDVAGVQAAPLMRYLGLEGAA